MELTSPKRLVSDVKEWSKLPQDMLDLIAQLLSTAQDFCRFGAVCVSWHKAAIELNYKPISDHQLPWFIIFSVADKLSSKFTSFNKYCFYDPCANRFYELQHTRLGAMPFEVVGAGHGWVAAFGIYSKEVVLFDPLRKTQIGLPPPYTSDTDFSHMTVVLSGSPRNGIFKALIHYAKENPYLEFMAHVFSYASGNPQWKSIQGADDHGLLLYNFTFFKDRLYAFHATDETLVVVDEEERQADQPYLTFQDVLELPLHTQLTESKAHYLVSGTENMFICVSTGHEPEIRYNGPERRWTWDWQVYRVEMKTKDSNGGGEEAKVVEMDGLGDGAIFISDKSSHYVSKLPNGKFKKNCIYFQSECFSGEKKNIMWESSFEDGTTKPFYTNIDTKHIPSCVWFVPSLW